MQPCSSLLKLLLIIFFLLKFTKSIFPFGCMDGYYENGNRCLPCNSSCKTCSQGDKCDTCEEFMVMNEVTGLCEHCGSEEYYDFTAEVCRDCAGSCKGYCGFREECFECPVDEIFDLERMECVETCDPGKIEVASDQILMGKICKNLEIYVDHFSTEVIEFGTLKYPYRTMKSAISEIINHYSHTSYNLTLYTRDIYLEMDTFFILNMTSLRIRSHPDLEERGIQPPLVVTSDPQIGISKKALAHLLKHTDVDPTEKIAMGNYTELEVTQLTPNEAGIIISRSNFEIKNLQLFSDDTSYFMFAYYLQDKIVRMEDLYFNVTGMGFHTYDPLGLWVNNIIYETSKARFFVRATIVDCNYPEANTTNTFYANNVTFQRTMDNYAYCDLFDVGIPGNMTITNFDCSQSSSNNEILNTCVTCFLQHRCLPDDDLTTTWIFDNTTHDGRSVTGSNEFVYVVPYLTYLPHSRKDIIIIKNQYFNNMAHTSIYGLLYFWGSGTEDVTFSNIVFQNISNVPFITQALTYAKLTADNFYLEKEINLQRKIFEIAAAGDFYISHVYMTNYTNDGANQAPAIDISPGPDSMVLIHDLHLKAVELENYPLLNIGTVADFVTVRDVTLEDVKMAEEESLFYLQISNSFSFTNMTFLRTTSIGDTDTESNLFGIQTIEAAKMGTGEIKDIQIEDSAISLINVNSVLEPSDTTGELVFESIEYVNSEIPTNRALISTDKISTNGTFGITFSDLKFENITFTTSGKIFEVMHQLPNFAILSNSTFTNISSGSINIEGGQSDGVLDTRFTIEKCTFENIQAPVNPFMSVQQKAIVEVSENSFHRITSITFISGIMNVINNAQVTVTDSNFTSNSAVTASIAKIETEGELTLDTCKIYDNFAITNGVYEVASSGVLNLKNSKVYQNYAIQYPLGTVFVSTDASNIVNTEIYNNWFIQKSSIETEISSDCEYLCFLESEMKAHLSSADLSATIEDGNIFQVLQGELNILNSTHIHDQSLIFSCFLATVLIDSSQISNIEFSKTPLNILESTFKIQRSTISSIKRLSIDDSFIVATSGTILLTEITYTSSTSQLIRGLNTHLTLTSTSFSNITECPYLASIILCDSLLLENITVTNSSPSSSTVLNIQGTKAVSISEVRIFSQDLTFVNFKDTSVDLISGVEARDLSQVFKFENSIVTLMENSSFISNNYANSGGAISLFNSKMTVRNCSFVGNKANQAGAILFECTSMDCCQLRIEDSKFEDNQASVKGGAIYYNYNFPTVVNTEFSNNTAPYGNDFASYPVRIGKVNSQINDDITLSNIGPGLTITEDLKLALLDFDDQVMVLDNSDQINILPKNSSTSSINGINVVTVTQGVATFNSISAHTNRQYKTSNFSMTSKAIDSAKIIDVKGPNFTQNDLIITFRDCQPGERILGQECQVCAAGTYSLISNSSECTECDLDADCLGGQEVSLRAGFWRRFHNSTKIAECIFKEACEGGYDPNGESPTICATGYTGNLCSQCLVNKEVKYERINGFECSKCPNPILNAIQVTAIIFLVIGFYIFMVVINVRKTSESELSVLLRIFTNYLQLITLSTSMTNDYPSALITLSVPIKMFGGSTDALLSFDCFIEDTEIKLFFDSNAIFKLFLLGLMPLILLTIMTIMWILIYYFRRHWVKDLTRNLVISFITIIFLLHPKLAERGTSIFKCIEIDEGYSVAKIDTNIECLSDVHIKWIFLVAVPILVIWVIACPLLSLGAILIGRYKPGHEKLKDYFLLMYQGLKPETIYWEFVNTLRKISILIFLLFTRSVAIVLSLIMLMVTARIEVWLKPYKNHEHFKAEFLAIMAGMSTISAALIYSQDEQNDGLNALVFVVIILLNLKFLVEWIFLIICMYKEKSKFVESIAHILKKILCKKIEIFSSSSRPSHHTRTQKVTSGPPKFTSQAKISTPKKLLKRPKKGSKKKISKKISLNDSSSGSFKENSFFPVSESGQRRIQITDQRLVTDNRVKRIERSISEGGQSDF